MTTAKSPKAIALVAYATAKRTFRPYRRKKSPKKFSQPQLVACLVLKEFFKTDYRGIVAILEDSSDLRQALELTVVPHYTTLQKASQRLSRKPAIDRLMKEMADIAIQTKLMKRRVRLAALDSTGFESHYVSAYFVRRKAKGGATEQQTTYKRVPKLGILADTSNHFVLSGVPSYGPSPDVLHWQQAIDSALARAAIKTLVADAGYDGEPSHVFARGRGIRAIIPPLIGRKTKKLPNGKWRKIMATRFNKKLYGQRWQVETVNSILKRRLGSFLRARTYWSQLREMLLRLFTYDVMVV